ncbi:MAG: hypothetical protein M3Q10_01485 [Chloroflexota bacterium]|nr:hypothetical protein [Chloroflexota bacterium]
MAANAPATLRRETWRDWRSADAPEPEQLYTRDELLELLARMGIDATESDLRYWEYGGVLPRAVRQWHDGAVRAVYPDDVAYWVKELRRLQRYEGLSLEEIAPRLRAHARLMSAHDRGDTEPAADLPQAPEGIRPWPALATELDRLARWWEHLAGVEADRVEVRVVGANGRATVYAHPTPGTTEAGRAPPSES